MCARECTRPGKSSVNRWSSLWRTASSIMVRALKCIGCEGSILYWEPFYVYLPIISSNFRTQTYIDPDFPRNVGLVWWKTERGKPLTFWEYIDEKIGTDTAAHKEDLFPPVCTANWWNNSYVCITYAREIVSLNACTEAYLCLHSFSTGKLSMSAWLFHTPYSTSLSWRRRIWRIHNDCLE